MLFSFHAGGVIDGRYGSLQIGHAGLLLTWFLDQLLFALLSSSTAALLLLPSLLAALP
jgi:hypothetical protein